ncbi:hypothetical protein F4782DRAFT_527274 [Xylaria castorea]|nr:hypothetical protein F4782DRAFT_527274 [Xylaria castorea]
MDDLLAEKEGKRKTSYAGHPLTQESQPTLFLVALISALPSSFALPTAGDVEIIDIRAAVPVTGAHVVRADDDWEVVFYTEEGSGGQCGGTSSGTQTGLGGVCKSVASGKACVDIKVNLGVTSCTFNWIKDGSDCNSGTIDSETTVSSGSTTRGYNLGDKVTFLSVGCNE